MALKILIIEDEEIIRSFLQKKLIKEGYDVYIADNADNGLKQIKELKPNLILLDIVMPNTGGFQLMEMMEKDGIKGMPVIVISNSGRPSEIEKARKHGAKDWIIKTEFDPQIVIKKVFSQIGK